MNIKNKYEARILESSLGRLEFSFDIAPPIGAIRLLMPIQVKGLGKRFLGAIWIVKSIEYSFIGEKSQKVVAVTNGIGVNSSIPEVGLKTISTVSMEKETEGVKKGTRNSLSMDEALKNLGIK